MWSCEGLWSWPAGVESAGLFGPVRFLGRLAAEARANGIAPSPGDLGKPRSWQRSRSEKYVHFRLHAFRWPSTLPALAPPIQKKRTFQLVAYLGPPMWVLIGLCPGQVPNAESRSHPSILRNPGLGKHQQNRARAARHDHGQGPSAPHAILCFLGQAFCQALVFIPGTCLHMPWILADVALSTKDGRTHA